MPMSVPRAFIDLAVLILLPALFFVPRSLPALEKDYKEPLYLEADSAEFSEAKSMSVYTGNVFVKQGSMELRGNQVRVRHDSENGPTFIIAIGDPVTYLQLVEGEQKPVEASALRMEYDRAKDRLTLIGQAIVFQGEDTFRNDRIVYDRVHNRIKAGTIAKGKERVQITISPWQR